MKDRKATFGFGAFVTVVVSASLATALVAGPAAGSHHQLNRKYTVALTGAQEVPPGDADGVGTGVVQVKNKKGVVCVLLKKIGNIGAATMAHIHSGATGVAGPIVQTLVTPVLKGKKYQKSKTCVTLGPGAALVVGLRDNPGGYYLNVHNMAFPDGAIRGQIG